MFAPGPDHLKNVVVENADRPDIYILVPQIAQQPSKDILSSAESFQKSIFKL